MVQGPHNAWKKRFESPGAYWEEWEGIPLCHVARTEGERKALEEKGVCGPGCS